jgi:hypothetical protein
MKNKTINTGFAKIMNGMGSGCVTFTVTEIKTGFRASSKASEDGASAIFAFWFGHEMVSLVSLFRGKGTKWRSLKRERV